MEHPKVSICMPIYNRNKFLPLIIFNLQGLIYDDKSKLEFVIDDDGTEKLFKDINNEKEFEKQISPITLKYFHTNNKRTIGEKRNNLIKMSTHKIIACMDSDDIYFPEYIEYSVETLIKNKYGLVGSNEMLFLYPHLNWKLTAIRCGAKRQIHEATCIFTKKHARSMGGFKKNNQGEGGKMVDYNDKNVGLTEITRLMVCICHDDNTINKDMFIDKTLVDCEFSPKIMNIINNIFLLNKN